MNYDSYKLSNATNIVQPLQQRTGPDLKNALTVPQQNSPLVLIAEDHEDTCLMLKTLLQLRGFNTLEAKDGRETVDKAVCERPDLILMDAGLPLLSGFEATRLIRNIKSLADIQIVFLSGYVQKSDFARAFALGANEFLIKPIDFEKLDGILDKVILEKSKQLERLNA